MIPLYIYNTQQKLLEDIPLKDKLLNYRHILYYDLMAKLKINNAQKATIINSYKIAISEIDYELQSLHKGDKKLKGAQSSEGKK